MTTTPAVAIGIDGYRAGWVAAIEERGAVTWATSSVPLIADVLLAGAVVGIDIPLGLVDSGWRECDHLAAQALGSRRSSIFMTPPRRVLELKVGGASKEETQRISRELTGQGTSVFALALAARILAVDAAVDRHEGQIIEVHPELSFAELSGGGPLTSKKSARGVGERIAALHGPFPSVAQIVAAAPDDVPIDDALDALAALWTAQRSRDGVARTLPPAAATRPFIAI